jgi:hypothetical protein
MYILKMEENQERNEDSNLEALISALADFPRVLAQITSPPIASLK